MDTRATRFLVLGGFILGVGLLVACDRSATEVPQPPRLSPLPPGTPPVAYDPLAMHLPRIVSHAEGGELTRMTLWAIGSDGLRERVFDEGGAGWGDWVVRGVPAGAQHPPALWEDYGADLIADAGHDGARSPVVAGYSYPGSGISPDRIFALPTDQPPFGTTGGYHDNSWDSRDWMRPINSVSAGDGSRVHIFGTWFDDGVHHPFSDLLQASFEVEPAGGVRALQSEPSVLPRLVVPINGTPTEMKVTPGPNSAILVKRTVGGQAVNQVFVFVTREPEGVSGQDGLAVWHDDGAGGSGWLDLGTPVQPPSRIVGPPLAVSWGNPATGHVTVNVFVVARRTEGQNRWELWERFRVDDGSSPASEGWLPWNNHGSPRWDPYDASKGQLLERGTKWNLTTGVTWQLDGVDRMNLFGEAEPETDRDGTAQPRRLVEYVWDGSVWTWGFHHRPPPSGLGVRSLSSAWTNKNGDIRISIACREESGAILERYYIIDQQGWHGWFWNDLTD